VEDIVVEPKDAFEWLSDPRWIIFAYEGGFGQYLESCYFAPGTVKSEEFEVLAVPLGEDGVSRLVAFFRIKDSVENRDSLRAALAEYFGAHLPTLADLDVAIETQRRRIQKTINQRFR
jgi:hypothetical protein